MAVMGGEQSTVAAQIATIVFWVASGIGLVVGGLGAAAGLIGSAGGNPVDHAVASASFVAIGATVWAFGLAVRYFLGGDGSR